MFGFGHGPELIIILVIALIVLGPGKIPEIAQMLGKGIRELRQASSDLQKTFDVNELMNPTPQPPVPPPMEAASTTETILPPQAAAKPKRTRKRAASVAVDDSGLAAATPSPSLSRKRERDSLEPSLSRKRERNSGSKKPPQPVSPA